MIIITITQAVDHFCIYECCRLSLFPEYNNSLPRHYIWCSVSELIEVSTMRSPRPKGPVRGSYPLQNQMYIVATCTLSVLKLPVNCTFSGSRSEIRSNYIRLFRKRKWKHCSRNEFCSKTAGILQNAMDIMYPQVSLNLSLPNLFLNFSTSCM
jgi:hypothetical protein